MLDDITEDTMEIDGDALMAIVHKPEEGEPEESSKK
jgi:hypothetical protein